MVEVKIRWYEWPLVIASAPFILALFSWKRWSFRRWERRTLAMQERWKREHPDWYGP